MTEPTSNEIRAALERILASRCFAQAGRASDFLRFVVETTLAGSGSRLKGYTIATEVFGRPADFDPQADPLVRVEAGRLRSRLAEYYQGEGAAEPIKIELPRGGYAVRWRRAGAEPPPSPRNTPGPTGRLRLDRLTLFWHSAGTVLAVALVAALGALVWHLRAQRAPTGPPPKTFAGEAPRVIVTPFENLTVEAPELSLLAAGLTEEVMLELGRLDVRVVSAEPPWLDVARVREQSAHDYVVSGSIRQSGQRLRVAARLIERGTGVQLWSRAFDRSVALETDAALQAALAQEIAGIARPYGPIFDTELARAPEGSPLSWDCLARYLDYRRTMEDGPFHEALECFQSVSLEQPASAAAWAGLAMLYLDDYGYRYGHTATIDASLMLAREAVERALALERNLPLANLARARLHLFDGELDELRRLTDAILKASPADAEVRAYLGVTLALVGDARGVELVDEALARSPRQPGIVNMAYAVDHLRHGRAREALDAAQRIAAPNWFPAQIIIAASAGLCGNERVAARARARLLELYPNFEAEAIDLFRQWQHDRALDEALLAGLEKAGLRIVAAEPLATQ